LADRVKLFYSVSASPLNSKHNTWYVGILFNAGVKC
jgi:hypothetical protein